MTRPERLAAMSGHCVAGERCSCGLDAAKRAACALFEADAAPVKVWGLVAMSDEQKPLIQKHCLGDCGKVSMAGVIDHPDCGPLWVCPEEKCPWLKAETEEPVGKTMSFGRPHIVYLRAITDTPQATEGTP